MKYKRFFINCTPYVMFWDECKKTAVVRRIYHDSNGAYFTLSKSKVRLNEKEVETYAVR